MLVDADKRAGFVSLVSSKHRDHLHYFSLHFSHFLSELQFQLKGKQARETQVVKKTMKLLKKFTITYRNILKSSFVRV